MAINIISDFSMPVPNIARVYIDALRTLESVRCYNLFALTDDRHIEDAGVTIVAVQPDAGLLLSYATANLSACDTNPTIGLWTWPFRRIPTAWRSLIIDSGINEIWVPSNYVREAFRLVTDIPVVTVPPPIFTSNKLSRPRLARHKLVFLSVFDPWIPVELANFEAVVTAYRLAFPVDDRTCLIIATPAPGVVLMDLCRQQRVQLVTNCTEIAGLIVDCDCLVAVPGAAGYCQSVLLAMAYLKPIIISALPIWAGYASAGLACVVTGARIQHLYMQEDVGRELVVNIDELAKQLRWVADNRRLARRQGQRAAKSIYGTRLGLASTTSLIKERLELLRFLYR